MSKKTRPFVSVVCPTFNRRRFLPLLIQQFLFQTYPQESMELIIVDDSPETNEDVILNRPNIKYYYLPEKLVLGKKRNYVNSLATGDIIVCFDDDDYYSPNRVSHAVNKLLNSRELIGGTSLLHVYDKKTNTIYENGPIAPNHGTNGTMAYKKEYLINHSYSEDAHKGEERSFTNDFTEPMVQFDPFQTMLCLAHNANTVDKTEFLNNSRKTKYKLQKFFEIKNKDMIEWIKNEM